MKPVCEQTIVFFKPGLGSYQAEVERIITSTGNAVTRSNVLLDEFKLRAVYPNTIGPLWSATLAHLLWKRVTILVISGPAIVADVYSLVGTEIDPLDCRRGSLRNYVSELMRYRNDVASLIENLPQLMEDGNIYYPNYIHRAQSLAEAQCQIQALMK